MSGRSIIISNFYLLWCTYFIIGYVCPSQMLADTIPNQYYFKHYSIEEGLSQVTNNDILKDSYDFLWVGTTDGLNRFDGEEFIIFKHNPKDSTSICGNVINTIYEDSQQKIWVSAYEKGICYFSYNQDYFRTIRYYKDGRLVDHLNVKSIAEDKYGNLWAASSNYGLLKITEHDGTWKVREIEILGHNSNTHALHITNSGQIWVSTNNKIAVAQIVDKSKTTQFKYISTSHLHELVNKFREDDFFIWGATNNGLWQYDKINNKDIKINISIPNKQPSEENFTVNDLMFDEDNNLWVGAADDGLFILSDRNAKSHQFTKSNNYSGKANKPFDFNSTSVYSLENYSKTNKIIGTSNLLNISTNYPLFGRISKTSKTIKLNHDVVFGIYENDMGLWIGTSGGGLNFISNEDVYYFKSDQERNSVNGNVVRVMRDGTGDFMWIGTSVGLSIINKSTFNPKNPIFINFQNSDSDTYGVGSMSIRDIYTDEKGQVWIATDRSGLYRFTGDINKNKFTFQKFEHNPNDPNTLPSNRVLSITESKDGLLWIGTRGGITSLSFRDDLFTSPKFQNYSHSPTDDKSLSDNNVYEIYIENDSILWVATLKGLSKLNTTTGSVKRFGTEDGLPHDLVYFIQPDEFGYLWLGTNYGLSRFHTKSEEFTNYLTDDGIQSNEYDLKARCRNSRGQLLLGGIRGIDVITPSLFFKNKTYNIYAPKVTKVLFNSDVVKGEQVEQGKLRTLLKQPLSELKFKKKEFPITLFISDIGTDITSNKGYQYKLDQSNQWQSVIGNNSIPLVTLPKGIHTLLLRTHKKGVFSEPTTVIIKVIPPWYHSNIAYIAYALLSLLTLYWLYKNNLKRHLAKRDVQRIKEVNKFKSKLYTNITHEIRTPLTVILGMSNKAISYFNEQKKDDFENAIEIVNRNGNEILELVNQLMDLSKLDSRKLKLNFEQRNIVLFISYLIESFQSLGDSKQLSIQQNHELNDIVMDFDQEKVRQIVYNLIGNAIKFSEPKSKIEVRTWMEDEDFQLTIKDHGIGIHKEDLPYIFDRFYQSEHISFSGGSGIGLSLTKELVELMKGKIQLNSKIGKGTTVHISLPITRNAEIKTQYPDFEGIVLQNSSRLVLSQESLTKLQILVIEDNYDVANYIASCLNHDYQILFAENGSEGIKMAIEHIPDLIISDVMMPKMNGYQVCSQLKSEVLTNHIPIILLTAKIEEESKLQGLKTGADAYLTKPFNETELIIRINKLVELRQALQQKYSLAIKDVEDHDKTSSDPFIEELSIFILKNISNPDLDVHLLCTEMSVSRSQLHRKTTALTGLSATKLINSIRLEKAKELLQGNKNLNISQIAYEVGFNDPSYFSRLFTKHFENPPSCFRDH